MTMEREIIHKEMDLIQNCINRMAQNSFFLKGWTISLVAVVIALGRDYNFKSLCLLLMLPTICFWYLDAYFLRIERMYRKLYEWVIANRHKTDEYLYDLNHKRFKKEVSCEFCIMVSKKLFVFYGIPMIVLMCGYIYHSNIGRWLTEWLIKLIQKG
jgi:hypothetical protein